MDTNRGETIDVIPYVHKKFGAIKIKDANKRAVIEISDLVERNSSKRVKVEALKCDSQQSYNIPVNSDTRVTFNKPPNLEAPTEQPLINLNSFQSIIKPNNDAHKFKLCKMFPSLRPQSLQPIVEFNIEQFEIKPSLKYPLVVIPRPSELLRRKLVERQLLNKAQNSKANVSMDTSAKEGQVPTVAI